MTATSSSGSSGGVYSTFVSYCVVPFIVKFLGSIVNGSSERLRLKVPPTGHVFHFGAEPHQSTSLKPKKNDVTLTVERPINFVWLLLLDQKIGLGESYMAGDWHANPGIKEFLNLLIRARKEKAKLRGNTPRKTPSLAASIVSAIGSVFLYILRYAAHIYNYFHHRLNDNTLTRASQNVKEHYGLGNDMFEVFLDETMTYSSALFEDPYHEIPDPIKEKDEFAKLAIAQNAKIDSLLDALELSEKDTVLEIGCGWGAMGVRAATKYGCKWVGLNVCPEQLEIANRRVKEAGLQDKVTFKLTDYRLEKGTYTRLVSVEMIENVGEKFLPEYFQVIQDRLEPGGIGVVQAIVCPDTFYDRYKRSSDYIRKHIFPGGHLPCIGAIKHSLPRDRDGLPIMKYKQERALGHHYSLTLDYWLKAWNAHEQEVLTLGYSRTFHRKWQFYFGLCSSLFFNDHIDVIQFSLKKPTKDGRYN